MDLLVRQWSLEMVKAEAAICFHLNIICQKFYEIGLLGIGHRHLIYENYD